MITTALVIVVRVSVVLGGAAIAAAALRRSSAATRHLVWAVAIAGSLVVPILSMAAPPLEIALLPASRIAATSVVRPLAAAAPSSPSEAIATAPRHEVPMARAESPALGPSAPRIALWLWLGGVALVLSRFGLGTARMRWIARRARRVDRGPWLRLAQRLAWLVGVKRPVTFLEGATAAMPMTWGIVNPCVLLPESASQWPPARQRVVLLHELAHVKRRDCLTQLFAQLVCAIYWFNPLAWFAAARLQAERERACDDVVLASGTRGSEYADHLLEIARSMRSSMFPTWAAVAMAHRSQLEGRLMAILDPAVPRRFPTRRRAAAVVAVLGVVLVPVAIVTPVPRAAEIIEVAQAPGPRATPVPLPAPAAQPPRATPSPLPGSRAELGSAISEAVKDAVPDATRDLIREGWLPPMVRGTVEAIGASVGQAVGQGVAGGVPGGVPGGVVRGVTGGVAGGVRQEVERETESDTRVSRDPRVVAALVEALKDSDKEVRESAMQALATMRAPEAVEAIRASLKDSNASVREQAVFALGQYRDRASVDALTGLLQDSSADVREQAVFALGQIRDLKSAAPLARALSDANGSVREQAAFALGQLRRSESVEPLIAALRDQSSDVREQAAFALGQIRDPRAVDALVTSLKDENPDVREQAAFALGQLRDPRAVEGLTSALKDPNAEVRRQAAFALGQISK